MNDDINRRKDGDIPEGVSKQEFAELQARVKELADALTAKSDAETATERQSAHADVVEARADLDALARELGVSPAKLREAADKAKRDEEKERLRPLLAELLDEELAAPPAPDEPDDEPDTEPADATPDPDAEPDDAAPDPAPDDSAPTLPHWSEKTVGQLLGR